MFGERINQRSEAELVFEERRDVIEQNAGFREVRHFANQIFQVLAVHSCLG